MLLGGNEVKFSLSERPSDSLCYIGHIFFREMIRINKNVII